MTHSLEDAAMGAFINDLRNDVLSLVASRLDSALFRDLSQELKLKTITAGIMMGLFSALFAIEKGAAERDFLRHFIRVGINPCADAAIDRLQQLFNQDTKRGGPKPARLPVKE